MSANQPPILQLLGKFDLVNSASYRIKSIYDIRIVRRVMPRDAPNRMCSLMLRAHDQVEALIPRGQRNEIRCAQPETKTLWATCPFSMTSVPARKADLEFGQVPAALSPKDSYHPALWRVRMLLASW